MSSLDWKIFLGENMCLSFNETNYGLLDYTLSMKEVSQLGA
jgi:hypothetical protein